MWTTYTLFCYVSTFEKLFCLLLLCGGLLWFQSFLIRWQLQFTTTKFHHHLFSVLYVMSKLKAILEFQKRDEQKILLLPSFCNSTTLLTLLHTLCAITALFSNKERIEIAVKIHNTYSKSEICDSDVPYVSGHNPRLAMLLLVSGSRYIFCELSSFVTMGSKFI